MKGNKGSKQNEKLIVGLVAITYVFSRYLPGRITSFVAIISACGLLYIAVKSRFNNEPYLYTGLYFSLAIVAFDAAIIKWYPGNIFDYYIYNKFLWPIFVIFGSLSLIFGFWGNLKHGDELKRKQVVRAIIVLCICTALVIVLKVIS